MRIILLIGANKPTLIQTTMKTYKATDHAKLSTKFLQDKFTIFMLNEYNVYVNNGDSTNTNIS